MSFVRKISRLKNQFTKTDLQLKLHKVTSNEKNFPAEYELIIIARESYKRNECNQITKHLFKKLQESYKKWRKILKALNLITILIKKGSKRVMRELKNKVFLVKQLKDFSYMEGSMDRGIKIREIADDLYIKIGNCDLNDYNDYRTDDLGRGYKNEIKKNGYKSDFMKNDERSKSNNVFKKELKSEIGVKKNNLKVIGLKESFLEFDIKKNEIEKNILEKKKIRKKMKLKQLILIH